MDLHLVYTEAEAKEFLEDFPDDIIILECDGIDGPGIGQVLCRGISYYLLSSEEGILKTLTSTNGHYGLTAWGNGYAMFFAQGTTLLKILHHLARLFPEFDLIQASSEIINKMFGALQSELPDEWTTLFQPTFIWKDVYHPFGIVAAYQPPGTMDTPFKQARIGHRLLRMDAEGSKVILFCRHGRATEREKKLHQFAAPYLKERGYTVQKTSHGT